MVNKIYVEEERESNPRGERSRERKRAGAAPRCATRRVAPCENTRESADAPIEGSRAARGGAAGAERNNAHEDTNDGGYCEKKNNNNNGDNDEDDNSRRRSILVATERRRERAGESTPLRRRKANSNLELLRTIRVIVVPSIDERIRPVFAGHRLEPRPRRAAELEVSLGEVELSAVRRFKCYI